MRFLFETLIARNLEGGGGGGAGAGGGDGGAPGAGAGNGQGAGSGAGQGQGAGGNAPGGGDLAARAAAILAGEQGGGAGNQQQQNNGQQQGADNNGPTYFPEGLNEQFRGTNDRETIDKLAQELTGRPQKPATPNDYKLELSEEFTKKFGDLKDDAVVPIWREVAHELGLDNKQFGEVIPKLFERMDKAGLLDKPIDFDAEVEKLAPKTGDPRQRHVKAAQRIDTVSNFVKGLETRGAITKAEAGILSLMHADASSVLAFEKVLALIPKEHGLQNGGDGSGGSYGWDQADRDMADERYSSSSAKYDPNFRKNVDANMQRLAPRKRYSLG